MGKTKHPKKVEKSAEQELEEELTAEKKKLASQRNLKKS